MKIKILYEDKDILAIDKPSGIAVHPTVEQAHYGAGSDGRIDIKCKEETISTISDWFLKNYPKAKNVGEPIFSKGNPLKNSRGSPLIEPLVELVKIPRPGIVHRLDKETSGVLLLAKNQKAYKFLKSQFQNREIKKTYHAIVSGNVKNDHATINKAIGRSPKDFRRHLAGRGVRGELREAITEYKVLKRFQVKAEHHKIFYARGSHPVLGEGRSAKKSYDAPLKFSYLEIYPKTGRTHQIRVHMKFINHPVVHDDLYNPNSPYPKDFKRLALHAKSIELKNLKGQTIKIESPLPKEFKKYAV